ncbi:hypothetical protein SNE40_015004 [Patella caerulea]|uniref:UspA domain-containing protein n=1 Tax=Patella caerulea TaxID=87958 RepID=A0AAN8JI32_PATCE
MATSEVPVTLRKVVVAIDGSKHAQNALDWYIKQVYRPTDEVILVYIPELSDLLQASRWENTVYMFDRTVVQSLLDSEQARIQKELTGFAELLQSYKVTGRVRSIVASKAGEGILQGVEEEKAEFVVVGCRGLGKIRRTFMGSVSDFVVHHSPVPVFVVRSPDDKETEKEKEKEKGKDK